MIRVIEEKKGKKSIFTVENWIDRETLLDKRLVNIQLIEVSNENKKTSILYDSNFQIIEDAYMFMNHNLKRRSDNTKIAERYALRYLYTFSEIINKDIRDFDKNDVIRLNYFLSGISAERSNIEYILLTKRSAVSINMFFSTYRALCRYLNIISSPFLLEQSYTKHLKMRNDKSSYNVHKQEIPKYISTEEYKTIIEWIRKNIENKEHRLRDECIIRIMYEGGARLGEVLGSTLEDYVIADVGEELSKREICFMYIRNRMTDRSFQKAKTCMNIYSKSTYSRDEYMLNYVGYQLIFLNLDTYDTICEYIDLAHERVYKKHRDNYDKDCADAVDGFKKKNSKNYYMFLNNRGRPLTDESWNKELRMIFEAVGIKIDYKVKKYNLSHRFRHGFIMHLIHDLKIPREQVMVRSRHKSYSSLDSYYNPTIPQIIKMKLDIQDRIINIKKSEVD